MDDLFRRNPANPILTADMWPYPLNSVFNPAAVQVGDQTILLVRCEDRRGVSHLAIVRSDDGKTNFKIDPVPFLEGDPEIETERYGFEDPRISYIEEMGVYAITCTTYGPPGPAVFLLTTTDFVTYEKKGILMPPEDKNSVILPRRVNGEWILLHRPIGAHVGVTRKGDIWLSRSTDLASWKMPERVMGHREGAWWDAIRIGLGPCPMETPYGWLMIYHGVKDMPSGPIYRVGAALLDLEDPTKVIHRSPEWIMGPREPYERIGDVGNVVFPCGMVHDKKTDELHLYYGAADSCVSMATASFTEVLDYVRQCPPDDVR